MHPARYCCIGSRAVEMATPIRRAGISCDALYCGKRAKQYRRAQELGFEVLDSDKPEDWARVSLEF